MAPTGTSGCISFVVQLLTGRAFTAFATIMILSFIGSSYVFGLYSNDIKSALGYDQTTLNLISFFKDLGAYVSIQAGLIMEVAPPWVVLCIGAAVNLIGYLMIWLSVTHRISRPPVWQMCMFICIGANSLGFANTGALVTCVKNFPGGNRGAVIGILKGYVGLGGAVMTQLYHAMYGNNDGPGDAVGVILLIAWLPALALVVFSFSVRVLDTVNRLVKRERKFFNGILYVSLSLAGFITVMIIVQKQVEFTKGGYAGSFAVIMALLVLPFFLVIKEEWITRKDKFNACNNATNYVPPEEVDVISEDKHVPWYQDVFRPPAIGEDHTILQATFRLEMQILLLATIIGTGGQLATIDNLGQIGISLGYPKKSISTFVSLLSIWQYLGRVLGGIISDYFLNKYKWPRPIFLSIILLVSCIGFLLIAFNVPYGPYLASIIIGFCFGAEVTYLFTILSELFGLKHYGTLYNYGSLGSPLGSYIFNVRVAGNLYDKEGIRQLTALGLTRKPGQELICNGVKCYQLAYIIITAATLFGSIVSLLLVTRTREFYKGDIYKRFHKDGNHLATSDELLTQNVQDSISRKKEDHNG